jgi:anti-anti-sigma factor
VDGEIDLDTAPQLLDTVLAALLIEAPESVPEVILDLDGVTFLDSSGIAALLYIHRYAASQGATLSITNVSNLVAQTIEVAGVSGTLGVTVVQPDVDPV